MFPLRPVLVVPLALAAACAHAPLAQEEAQRMVHPAFVVRVAGKGEGLGGVPRYELAERLRAGLFQALPRKAPWTGRVDPLAVVRELQLLLVQDEADTEPDFGALRNVGADGVVDVKVERWGRKPGKDKVPPQVFAEGRARAFLLSGGTIWSGRVEVQLPAAEGLTEGEQRQLLLEAFTGAGTQVAAGLSPEAAAQRQNR
jgi:hypothetical protein